MKKIAPRKKNKKNKKKKRGNERRSFSTCSFTGEYRDKSRVKKTRERRLLEPVSCSLPSETNLIHASENRWERSCGIVCRRIDRSRFKRKLVSLSLSLSLSLSFFLSSPSFFLALSLALGGKRAPISRGVPISRIFPVRRTHGNCVPRA